MNKITKYILALACIWAIASCARVEEPSGDDSVQEKVEMTLTATIVKEFESKTTLEGNLDDGVLKTVWVSGDEIGLATTKTSGFNKFVNKNKDNSEEGIFQGSIEFADTYRAIYPYEGNGYHFSGEYGGWFYVNLPQVQHYAEGSFASGAAPMVARAPKSGILEFINVCGLLALRLQGDEAVKSIVFTGKDNLGNLMNVSGFYAVNMEYDEYPSLTSAESVSHIFGTENKNYASVTLVCDEPVQLNTSESTPFFFVLPPATYETFTLIITTADGDVMIREGKNPLTIERAHAKPTGALQYAESLTIDLSEEGTANCYIVPDAGVYSFDASTIGNGKFGLIEGAGFHTSDPSISPVSADIVWEDTPGVVAGVSYNNGKISFVATGMKGNALLAARDENNEILWSWHIWCTDQPGEQFYFNNNGEYYLLDRNLGAIEYEHTYADRRNLFYQWGRKDPFLEKDYYDFLSSPFETIRESIASPATFASSGSGQDTYWYSGSVEQLWSYTKTIYDPCPTGWKVAIQEVWTGTESSPFDPSNLYGIIINHPGDRDVRYWYQSSDIIGGNGECDGVTGYTYLWTAEYCQYMRMTSCEDPATQIWEGSSSMALPIRCMKAEDFVIETTQVSDKASNSAMVSGLLSVYANVNILETGFVYGTSESVTLDNGTKVAAGNSAGTFTAELTGLSELTKYYVRAYVTTDEGTSYGATLSFITPNTEGVVDLSVGGTANCYHVVIPGRYKFDARYRGNSLDNVGDAVSAEVLWEFSDPTFSSTVISSVELVDGFVEFEIPNDVTYGNALIAVKNASGTILWSWHIWLCDFDPDGTAQKYKRGHVMMDRNLGATLSVFSDYEQSVRAYGMMYQWGRKDPINEATFTIKQGGFSSLEDAHNSPTTFATGDVWVYMDDGISELWSYSRKTKYDPCPPGWKVPDSEVWYNLYYPERNDNGISFKYDDSKYAYYPYRPYIDINGDIQTPYYVILWTSEGYDWGNISVSGPTGSNWYIENRYKTDCLALRCMKDPNVDLTTVNVQLHSTSADFYGNVNCNGSVSTERGFVWYAGTGVTRPTLTDGYSSSVAVDGGAGTFNATAQDLRPDTEYYLRAYAIVDGVTIYGNIIKFKTRVGGTGDNFTEDDYEW